MYFYTSASSTRRPSSILYCVLYLHFTMYFSYLRLEHEEAEIEREIIEAAMGAYSA